MRSASGSSLVRSRSRAVLVHLVEDTLLYGDDRSRQALRAASGPATRAAIAATDDFIRGPS